MIENTENILNKDIPSGVDSKPVLPKTYFVQSIIATVLCCMPVGLFAIINASKVERLYNQGDYSGADLASKLAYKWIKIAVVVWLCFIIGFTIYAALFLSQDLV